MTARDYVEGVLQLWSQSDQTSLQRQIYQYILDHGQEFDRSLVLSKASAGLRARLGARTKECFYNAQRAAILEPMRYRYFEGFAVSLIPVHHAWIVTDQGAVLDPTWVNLPQRTELNYFGMEIPYQVVMEEWLQTEVANDLLLSHVRYLLAQKNGQHV